MTAIRIYLKIATCFADFNESTDDDMYSRLPDEYLETVDERTSNGIGNLSLHRPSHMFMVRTERLSESFGNPNNLMTPKDSLLRFIRKVEKHRLLWSASKMSTQMPT